MVVETEKKTGLWQDIIKAKYFKRSNVADVKEEFDDSPCRKAILKVKEFYMAGRQIDVHSRDIARLWKGPPERQYSSC